MRDRLGEEAGRKIDGKKIRLLCPIFLPSIFLPEFFLLSVAQYTSTNTAACSADFTTSSNFRSFVSGSFNFADTSGTESRNGRDAFHSVPNSLERMGRGWNASLPTLHRVIHILSRRVGTRGQRRPRAQLESTL
jgi:hypothetical protein